MPEFSIDTLSLFVGGVETGSSNTPDILFDTNDVLIGSDENNNSEGAFFEGAIDDVRIYSRALTPAEMMALATM